jgi:hypothetical protein
MGTGAVGWGVQRCNADLPVPCKASSVSLALGQAAVSQQQRGDVCAVGLQAGTVGKAESAYLPGVRMPEVTLDSAASRAGEEERGTAGAGQLLSVFARGPWGACSLVLAVQGPSQPQGPGPRCSITHTCWVPFI